MTLVVGEISEKQENNVDTFYDTLKIGRGRENDFLEVCLIIFSNFNQKTG